ncbi:phage integrase central domain-containing protein [Kushneria phosphatilytica]|uniref:Tyrosine-type recombinase/integrase n=1 Tax=Kushneria phosphatilytica TaxID=657387 RepID=A0A1S1NZ29_9GAMM|nr:tyrosine-type recombinase/integrase [Kushneria phosphatilytica]OHV13023.1 hypothetical protein BH688_03205 [Kushneria phosphatilytica]QEL10895.1 tyrosine-type recombinase/integrase [Kushneria phosphatilytica]
MNIMNNVMGKVSPRYRSLSRWCENYVEILSMKDLSPKTMTCRRANINNLIEHLGDMAVAQIQPMHVARAVRAVTDSGRPYAAKNMLKEANSVFNEALLAGWALTNPAAHLKPLRPQPARSRLSLEQWQRIYRHAEVHGQGWLTHALRLALLSGQRRTDLVNLTFKHEWDGHLHVHQQKTGERIAIPTCLGLNAIGMTLADALEECRRYHQSGTHLLRKKGGKQLGAASLSTRFAEARDHVIAPGEWRGKMPATFHEIRSLSERLYRDQGVDTMTLLGHRSQKTTDGYNDDRGLTHGTWRTVEMSRVSESAEKR